MSRHVHGYMALTYNGWNQATSTRTAIFSKNAKLLRAESRDNESVIGYVSQLTHNEAGFSFVRAALTQSIFGDSVAENVCTHRNALRESESVQYYLCTYSAAQQIFLIFHIWPGLWVRTKGLP